MLKVHIELQLTSPSGTKYMPHTELVDSLSGDSFAAIREKCEVDGWVLCSWSVSEQLPYDEGYSAAMEGHDSDTNPYAEHFWKHNEWWMGWDSHQEANS